MSDERVLLTPEEAEAMLPQGEVIHTFRTPGPGMFIGADWSREDIIKALRDGKPELSGEIATSMKHGMVLLNQGGSHLFIETAKAKSE